MNNVSKIDMNLDKASDGAEINVEIVYALPEEQTLLNVRVSSDAGAKDVIEHSGILELYPELKSLFEEDKMEIGLFGKLGKMNQSVREKDRIEIYRPLIADPKEVRKKRAAEGKRMKKGGAEE